VPSRRGQLKLFARGYAREVDAAEIDAAFKASPLFQQLVDLAAKDDRTVLDSEAKRHHVVPRFLLENFTSTRGEERALFQLDVGSGKPSKVSPVRAGARRNFYTISGDEGERHNRLEGFLSIVEGHAAPALANLLGDPADLTAADRATLSFFFALLDVRTPGAATRMQGMSATMMRMMFATSFEDKVRFVETYRQLFDTDADEETIEEFRQDILRDLRGRRVDFADARGHALTQGIRAAGAIAPLIYGMEWMLLASEQPFFTSDRGLAIYDPEPPFPWSSQAWASSPHVEAAIPLSNDCCLLLRHLDPDVIVSAADGDLIDEINLRSYGWAGDFTFGCTQEVLARVRRHAKRRPQDVKRPRPFHQTLLLEADPSDTSLADSHRRRGWPPYLLADGVVHDYIVIGPDSNAVDLARDVSDKVRERARRAMHLPEGATPPGRAVLEPFSSFSRVDDLCSPAS
jgi:hypothetical protein